MSGNTARPVSGTGFVQAEVSLGFNLDGSDDALMIPGTPALDVGRGEGFTVEFWVKTETINTPQTLFGWIDGQNVGVSLRHNFFTVSGGKIRRETRFNRSGFNSPKLASYLQF